MTKGEYYLLKAMFESFGRDLLEEFKKQYEEGIDLEATTQHEVDTIIKAATKCFLMYMRAKQ